MIPEYFKSNFGVEATLETPLWDLKTDFEFLPVHMLVPWTLKYRNKYNVICICIYIYNVMYLTWARPPDRPAIDTLAWQSLKLPRNLWGHDDGHALFVEDDIDLWSGQIWSRMKVSTPVVLCVAPQKHVIAIQVLHGLPDTLGDPTKPRAKCVKTYDILMVEQDLELAYR